jgi:hypothetical protein
MSIPITVIFKKFPATSEAASTATTCCHHTSRVLNTLAGYLNDASAKSKISTFMLTSPTTPQRTPGSSLAARPSSKKSAQSSTTTSSKACLKTTGHPTPSPTSSIAKHPVAALQRSQLTTAHGNCNNMLFNTAPRPLHPLPATAKSAFTSSHSLRESRRLTYSATPITAAQLSTTVWARGRPTNLFGERRQETARFHCTQQPPDTPVSVTTQNLRLFYKSGGFSLLEAYSNHVSQGVRGHT